MAKTEITNEQKKEIREFIDNFTAVWTDFMDKLWTELELDDDK